jgi:hypothetical protein
MANIFKPSPERAARKAERERMYAAEDERIRIARGQDEITRRRNEIARKGYAWTDGRTGRLGGYGVWISGMEPESSVTVGDRSLGDAPTTRLAGAHAQLETLAQARDRVTLGRVAALGVFALAVPKRDYRLFLLITGADGFEAGVVVDGSTEVHLREFVVSFNRLGAGIQG